MGVNRRRERTPSTNCSFQVSLYPQGLFLPCTDPVFMYYELAHLYDWPGAADFAESVQAKALERLAAYAIHPPGRIIDLACGTGTLAIALAQAGYNVTGLDLSEPMLAQAKRKQQALDLKNELSLTWLQGDMRYFLTDTPYDAVLCHHDSLNHLSNETELRAVFLQAAQALKPGGLFLFDLNTLDNFQTFWNGADTYEGPNYQLKTVSSFDENLGKASVQFLVNEYTDSGELISRQEEVVERYFNEAAAEKYLLAADFYEIRWEPFNPVRELSSDFPLKTFWQCRKR